jgi:hypothetical protein
MKEIGRDPASQRERWGFSFYRGIPIGKQFDFQKTGKDSKDPSLPAQSRRIWVLWVQGLPAVSCRVQGSRFNVIGI